MNEDMFQRLHDSEINFSITCFYDSGFTIRLGDEINGYGEEMHCEDWESVMFNLDVMARVNFPGSEYAQNQED